MSALPASSQTGHANARRPRIGFLGAGWIGRARMRSLACSGVAEVVAAADPSAPARAAVMEAVPGSETASDLDGLLALRLDGIVIATPSALHAEQATAALARGVAVYCQKPLARDRAETRRVLKAARRADRLLGVDLCYRHTDAAQALHRTVASGALGDIFAAELVFHNAYGPDKPWFTQRTLAGGGCLIDLGTHLADLALGLLGWRTAEVVSARLLRRGRPVDVASEDVEDFVLAELRTDAGTTVRLACSWFLPAGRDCVFECTLYGTEGAVSMRNLHGSFYDFVAERYDGTRRHGLSVAGEDWGSRGIVSWAQRLGRENRFDLQGATELDALSGILDEIYEAGR